MARKERERADWERKQPELVRPEAAQVAFTQIGDQDAGRVVNDANGAHLQTIDRLPTGRSNQL